MPAYLSKIAAAATSAGGQRRLLIPAVRSRSPIAERDQRLTLAGADWSLDDPLASDTAPVETPVAMEPASFIEPSTEQPVREISPRDFPSPISPKIAAPPERADLRAKSAVPPARSGSAEPAIGAVPLILPLRESPRRAEAAPERRADLVKGEGDFSAARADLNEHPSSSPKAALETTIFPSDPIAGTPLQPREVREPARPLATSHRLVPAPPSPFSRSSARPVAARNAEPPAPLPEPAPAGVIIDHLHIEVVPPPAEKPQPKPAAPAPASPAPISQIGPLRGVAAHLAFAIRHR